MNLGSVGASRRIQHLLLVASSLERAQVLRSRPSPPLRPGLFPLNGTRMRPVTATTCELSHFSSSLAPRVVALRDEGRADPRPSVATADLTVFGLKRSIIRDRYGRVGSLNVRAGGFLEYCIECRHRNAQQLSNPDCWDFTAVRRLVGRASRYPKILASRFRHGDCSYRRSCAHFIQTSSNSVVLNDQNKIECYGNKTVLP